MHWLRAGAEHFTLSLTREDLTELVRDLEGVPTLPAKLEYLRWLCQMVAKPCR